jgi:hypothetical protein
MIGRYVDSASMSGIYGVAELGSHGPLMEIFDLINQGYAASSWQKSLNSSMNSNYAMRGYDTDISIYRSFSFSSV